MSLKKKVLSLLTAGMFVVALAAAPVLLTGCPDEPEPLEPPEPVEEPEEPDDGLDDLLE